MKEITKVQKIVIQVAVMVIFLSLCILSFFPTIFGFALLKKVEFANMMFYAGVGMGSIYDFFFFGDSIYRRKPRPNGRINYLWSILPSSYLLSCFTWYFLLLSSKMLAEDKADAEFFQGSMMAFTIFFLLVKIAKEIKILIDKYAK